MEDQGTDEYQKWDLDIFFVPTDVTARRVFGWYEKREEFRRVNGIEEKIFLGPAERPLKAQLAPDENVVFFKILKKINDEIYRQYTAAGQHQQNQ